MWACPSCEEQVEEQFDVCWKCGTSRDGVRNEDFVGDIAGEAEETPNNETADANITPERMLNEILMVQREQQEALKDIQWKVGCLFLFMVVIILLGALECVIIIFR